MMRHLQIEEPFIILLLGFLLIIFLLVKAGARRLRVPALLGYILVGFVLRTTDAVIPLLSTPLLSILDILGKIGVIVLLFRIGLESDLMGLVKKLRSAAPIWLASILGSGFLGFAAVYWLLSQPFLPSLFVGIALTATSVGVSLGVWTEAGRHKSESGELLLDVVELDDISGVIMMAILFGLSPMFADGDLSQIGSAELLLTGGFVLVKLALFILFCYLFLKYLERPFTRFCSRTAKGPLPMLTMVGVTFVISALAGLLGFSVAIGAFFAGVIFSRDREAVRMEASFENIYHFFMPFFFIWIGISISPSAITGSVLPGLVLLLAAAAGKFIFSWLPALPSTSSRNAVLIGVSMIPRAEVSMIIMQHGLRNEAVGIGNGLFGGMLIVVLMTCLFVPLLLRRVFSVQRQPEHME
jgi:Kef-type K+ transport system membrane component KefB